MYRTVILRLVFFKRKIVFNWLNMDILFNLNGKNEVERFGELII